MAAHNRWTPGRSTPVRAAIAALAAGVGLALVPGLATAAPSESTSATSFSSSFEAGDAAVKVSVPFGTPTNVTGSPFAAQSLLGSIAAVTASGENPPSEIAVNLADGNAQSKWLVRTNTAWAQYQLASAAAIDSYTLTSANDSPGRDPKNWTLQGSTDGTTWTTVDTQTGQTWKTTSNDNRYQTKTFTLSARSAEFSYYRLNITANNGDSLTQLADWDIQDSTRASVAGPMTTKQDTGPTSSSTAKTGVGFTGVQSMSYSGRVIGTGDASSTNVLYDNVNVPVTAGMQLSYKLFPTLDNGITYAATYAAVDLAFTDGTRLSTDYNLTDQNGFAVDAASEGTSDSRWPDQWNSETIDLSSLAGKTVEKILFTVHLPEGAAGATADTSFKG